MTTQNASQYVITDDSQLIKKDADLDHETHLWPDGTPMTEANTEEYTQKRAAQARLGGRPSLGAGGSSPQVAFRISKELREHAEKVAASEGRTVSAIAREALERYVSAH